MYSVLTFITWISIIVLLASFYYPLIQICGIIATIPAITYSHLVKGGCSLRFRICALVKGIIAGLVFLLLSIIADNVVWGLLAEMLYWTPIQSTADTGIVYQIWLLSGVVGGFAARIVEVRQERSWQSE